MRLENLSREEEDEWCAAFRAQQWILGSLALTVAAEEAGSRRQMHFGYYLQPVHLEVDLREGLPRRLLAALARRRPPVDFLELLGTGIRIPHAFPTGFTIESVLRIVMQELERLE